MQRKRFARGWAGLSKAIDRCHLMRSASKPRKLLIGVTWVSLSLALAACSGGGGSDGDISADSKAAVADAAVAASAASSTIVTAPMALKMNTSSITPDTETDRFIVKYKTGTSERGATSAVQSRLDKLASAFPAKAHHTRRMGIGADVITTERKLHANEAKAFMRAIASDPDVEYVEPDVPMSASMIPNDPLYGNQWGFTPNEATNKSAYGIHAEQAWEISTGAGVVIAELDTGVTSHVDLDANILPGYDFDQRSRGGNGSNPGITTEGCSVTWHGTHVAGILSAVTNNGSGIAGTAGGAKVVPVRVLNGCGSGLMSNVADGITWASGGKVDGVPTNAFPAKILNLSLGGQGSCSLTYQNAIDDAVSRGASVIVAAGNNNLNSEFYQPSSCRNVIVVSGNNVYGNRSLQANYGPVVDIAAPSENIWSTYNYGTSTPVAGDAYQYLYGTSMATPFVSGVIALVQAVTPTPLTPAEMRALLKQNARKFPDGQPDQPLGAGVLDAAATVAAAKSGKIPAAADFSCAQDHNGLVVRCKDLSTARGAPIKSWAWNFGTGDPDFERTQSVDPYLTYEYPGNYDITLKVTDNTGAVSNLTRLFQVVAPSVTVLSNNVTRGFSGSFNVMQFFSLDVPAGATSVTFNLSLASSAEAGTLYLRSGTPTIVNAQCLSVAARGAAATCTVSNPAGGTYYATVNPNTNLTEATILATYTK